MATKWFNSGEYVALPVPLIAWLCRGKCRL